MGGGSELNTAKHSLARISLRWMISEIMRTGTGIRFNDQFLMDTVGLDPTSLSPNSEFTTPKEAEAAAVREELEDMRCAVHDQLSISKYKLWWILELIPLNRPTNGGRLEMYSRGSWR